MIHHWEGLDLEITDFIFHHDATPYGKLYHLKPQNLKHVGIIKISDKATYDTSLERF